VRAPGIGDARADDMLPEALVRPTAERVVC